MHSSPSRHERSTSEPLSPQLLEAAAAPATALSVRLDGDDDEDEGESPSFSNGDIAGPLTTSASASSLQVAARAPAASRPMARTHVPSIADFQIIRPISKGAFGRVYLARKKSTGDFFAVKVQRKDKALGRGASAKRVMSERDILVKADHPFVVKLFFCFQVWALHTSPCTPPHTYLHPHCDRLSPPHALFCSQSRHNLYLVMEYLAGGDLHALLTRVGFLEEQVCALALLRPSPPFGLSALLRPSPPFSALLYPSLTPSRTCSRILACDGLPRGAARLNLPRGDCTWLGVSARGPGHRSP